LLHTRDIIRFTLDEPGMFLNLFFRIRFKRKWCMSQVGWGARNAYLSYRAIWLIININSRVKKTHALMHARTQNGEEVIHILASIYLATIINKISQNIHCQHALPSYLPIYKRNLFFFLGSAPDTELPIYSHTMGTFGLAQELLTSQCRSTLPTLLFRLLPTTPLNM
jgi:hypothetical protein